MHTMHKKCYNTAAQCKRFINGRRCCSDLLNEATLTAGSELVDLDSKVDWHSNR